MTFTITVDTARWRANAEAVRTAISDRGVELVPVVKGNGYGLGDAAVAAEAGRLGCRALAVGTVGEAAGALEAFDGDVLVLEPWDPRDPAATTAWANLDAHAGRLVRTVASRHALDALAGSGAARPRVVLEALTSMHRFGLRDDELPAALAVAARATAIEGLAVHLPLAQPVAPHTAMLHDVDTGLVEHGSARAREAIGWGRRWMTLLADALGEDAPESAITLWASHLDDDELASVRAALPALPVRARVGTRLWHGDRGALQATGTVLAVHANPGPVGYRQRRAPRDGAIAIVSGGTAHGVALTAPSSLTSWRARASAAASGAFEAAGRSRSPFTWAGGELMFAEPPHVSVSLLAIPAGAPLPEVGTELPCRVRFTTTRADRVVWA